MLLPLLDSGNPGGSMNRLVGAVTLALLATLLVLGAEELPLVYTREDMNTDARKPPLPTFADLSSIAYLPDPFRKADGTRITTKDEWRARRAEIRAYLEHYDVG